MVATIEAPQIAQELPEHSGSSGETEGIGEQRVQRGPTRRSETQFKSPPAVVPPPNPILAMDKGRFASGLLLSSLGIGCLLMIAIGALQQADIAERFSMPIVACAAIMGIMMLGGGFGLMATAAAGLDDGEFERLMEAGNISAAETSARFSRGQDEGPMAAEPIQEGTQDVEGNKDLKPLDGRNTDNNPTG